MALDHPRDAAAVPDLGWSTRPHPLGPNQPPRPYLGGDGIARLRGTPRPRPNAPEDFVGSTTEVGPGGSGLTRLPDGHTLREHVAAHPEAYLGPEHLAAYGADPGLLVKLLDTGERLFVHFHPDDAFAARHLGCRHGKSEAWIVTDVAPPADEGVVYLGFAREVTAEQVRAWVAEQRVDDMLGTLNRLPVRPGDCLFVPAGIPHAVGAGVTAVELQEPTDFSILMEWRGPGAGESDGHLGLGYDTALQALDRSRWDPDRLAGLRHPARPTGQPGVHRLFPPAADRFFRAERLVVDGTLDSAPGFAILVVLDGTGELASGPDASQERIALTRGTCVLIPYGAGPYRITGSVRAIRCRPPREPE
jgi:mannose-6-phosphate isomerase